MLGQGPTYFKLVYVRVAPDDLLGGNLIDLNHYNTSQIPSDEPNYEPVQYRFYAKQYSC